MNLRSATVALVLACASVSAHAQTASVPKAILMPVSTLKAIREYLGTRPFEEVHVLVAQLEECGRLQLQDGHGGDCPDVASTLAEARAATLRREPTPAQTANPASNLPAPPAGTPPAAPPTPAAPHKPPAP